MKIILWSMIMIKMKPLLKESTWTNRKFGESLPTLEDYMGESYDDEDCEDVHPVVSEADPTNDDDKYVSVGWGKYKEKGKEDDKTAPTFKKTDDGKYVKGKDDEKGKFTPDKEEKPEKEPVGKLGGGDFERDFDDDEDDYDMGVVPGSRELDDTPEDDSEKGSSLTGAPGRDFEDDPDDIDNLDTALDDDPTRGDPDDEEAARAQAMKDMEDEFGDMGEITIDGKKYKPITESIKPKIYDPYREIKKQFKRVSLRQFDRRWQK